MRPQNWLSVWRKGTRTAIQDIWQFMKRPSFYIGAFCLVLAAVLLATRIHPEQSPSAPGQSASAPTPVPLPTLPVPPATSPQPSAKTQPTTASPKKAIQPANRAPQRYVMPVHGAVLKGFGWAYSPVLKEWDFHPGWDVKAPVGAQVLAFDGGRVMTVSKNAEQGSVVTVKSSGGIVATYEDLQAVDVKPGAQVSTGSVLGQVGQPGSLETNEPAHLHLSITVHGQAANPATFFKAQNAGGS